MFLNQREKKALSIRKGIKMTNIKGIIVSIAMLVSCGVLYPWEADWVNGEENGIFLGTATKGYTEKTDIGFIVHTVGDPSKPIIYSYYLIPDLHIGDLGEATFPYLDSQEDPNNIYADYNLPGWKPNLDLRPAVQEEGIWRPAGILPLPMP